MSKSPTTTALDQEQTPCNKVTPPTPRSRGLRGFLRDAMEDISVVQRHDPAAREPAEVLLTYPGLHALWAHRVSNRLFRDERFVAARVVSHLARHFTGVEIHPGATIGRRVFIDHGMGVVIGETAVIGDDCLIYQGVVLGGTTLERKKRHPTLGQGVVVGSNASVLGPLNICDGARVGSGSVVIKDVPVSSTVVGIPGRIVSQPSPCASPTEAAHDHASLPDPVQRTMRQLVEEITRLTERLETLEARADLSPEELAGRLARDEDQDDRDQELLRAYNDGAIRG